jgi:hypothetical protein
MSKNNNDPTFTRPGGITFLVVINLIGGIITLLFWLSILFRKMVPYPGELAVFAERANAATTYGFMTADLVYSVPLLFTATIGLWRMRPWGWTAAQMVNILWIFSLTVIWIRDLYSRISPGAILFLPFTVVAVWAAWYLWRKRRLFWG